MDDKRVTSASEFLELIKLYQSEFGQSCPSGNFIFRGVGSPEYQLLPKVFRVEIAKKGAKDFVRGESILDIVYADSEFKVLESFRKSASAFLPSTLSYGTFSLMQYAQHYGVPTRLLDFTTSPLTALHFCCKSKNDTDGVLWIMNVTNFKKWTVAGIDGTDPLYGDPKNWSCERMINNVMEEVTDDINLYEGFVKVHRPIFFLPTYIDSRMSGQASCFLVWGWNHNALETMVEQNNWMDSDVDSMGEKDEDDQRFLAKIIIPKEHKRSILNELDMIGVNEKAIFPGLDGIGQYLERRHQTGLTIESASFEDVGD